MPEFIVQRELGYLTAEGAARRIMAGANDAEKSVRSREEALRILGPEGFKEVYPI